MIRLTHHDDGKQKFQSHMIGIADIPDFYNADYDVISHNFFDLYGYGETKDEAIADFKRKFEYILKEWNAFDKLLFDTDVIENNIMEVDCFGKEVM